MQLYFNSERSVFFLDPTLQGVCWRELPSGQRVGLEDPADPMPVSYETTLKPVTFADRVQFGDGYEQVTESGVRSSRRVYEVRFSKIPDARAIALQRFFRGEGINSIYYRRPSEWFYWLPPRPLRTPDMVTPLKFICLDKWSVTPDTYNSNTVSATFEESFTP